MVFFMIFSFQALCTLRPLLLKIKKKIHKILQNMYFTNRTISISLGHSGDYLFIIFLENGGLAVKSIEYFI